MARETLSAREYSVNPINAVSNGSGNRRQKVIREFLMQRERYVRQLKDFEERYNHSADRNRYATEKNIEFLNQRIREMDANIAYIMRFT